MGSPALDYWVCHKGLFVAIEAKAPDGHMTDRQVLTAYDVIAAKGGVFCVNTAKSGEIDELRLWLLAPYPGPLGQNWVRESDLYQQRISK